MSFDPIETVIDAIQAGQMVVLMDDEERENEGDLIMAAPLVSAPDINFMARHGRGLICLTLTRERCRQLRLPLMVDRNQQIQKTNFTLSIEAAQGVSTGISAADRSTTIRAAVAPQARPDDLIQPGHVFPLMAKDGGVLTRAGHTEAGCDLVRLAGIEPASAVIVEILNEDGSLARKEDLIAFSQHHNLRIGSIEDLIRYRLEKEKSIERVAEMDFPSQYGDFRLYGFQDSFSRETHLALVRGRIDENIPVAVRVHVENLFCDSLGARHGSGWPLSDALKRIGKAPVGVLVLLRKKSNLMQDLEHFRVCSSGHEKSNEEQQDWRSVGIGAQILSDLGVRHMHLLSAPRIFHGLSAFGLEIVAYMSREESSGKTP